MQKMQLIHDYVKNLSDAEKRKIIADYVMWEHTGSIGDAPLRIHAEHLIGTENGVSVLLTMDRIGIECYRYFAELYLTLNP